MYYDEEKGAHPSRFEKTNHNLHFLSKYKRPVFVNFDNST